MSPLRLGDTKYGMPYSGGKVNVRNTLWEKDPKAAMGLSLIEVAKDGADPSYAEKLLRIGADPNYPCPYKEKYSALHLAAIKGQTELARLLVKSGGDPHKRCKLGSAMDLARKYGNTETLSAMQEELKQRKK
ncbi:hypothetical protein GUITHDRAFT_121135 [Guillardia theta CCMP2712]|uniref:Uncharacterized protein n=1 Tax=Guillardia theta (strain CCMP2712) TaxID=905079 RepID=L1IA21_GUITC|nr:hypothetical protein GUITHDRAFT_121135 [Guillardia theta CCMP2712]EKX32695.1 hypothetical protein GUITHDRAFT_121135 [Guillardia theta CCMP2712]|eukprot:XP_005819675.1 hypothetical protein GUITHDRAFT_121135 [Guillardia theta CCMP2712]